jgi:hypothetical protein
MDTTIISILAGIGISILLTEKGGNYPIRYFRVNLRIILRKLAKLIYYKQDGRIGERWLFKRPEVILYCPICLSFWFCNVIDLILNYCISSHICYIPLTGFIGSLVCWVIFELFHSISSSNN